MTKQLNKKGTSLVELIAVIVIMGIIAGIAIPTTIAVINRQKKNAAAKSAESLVSTMKNIALEAQAQCTAAAGTCTVVADYSDDETDAPTLTVMDGATDKTTAFGYTNADIKIDNLKAVGKVTVVLTISSGDFTYTPDGFTINSYTISIADSGSCSAS